MVPEQEGLAQPRSHCHPQHGGVRSALHTPGHHGERAVPLSGKRSTSQKQVSRAAGTARRALWVWLGLEAGGRAIWCLLGAEPDYIREVWEGGSFRGAFWTESIGGECPSLGTGVVCEILWVGVISLTRGRGSRAGQGEKELGWVSVYKTG